MNSRISKRRNTMPREIKNKIKMKHEEKEGNGGKKLSIGCVTKKKSC